MHYVKRVDGVVVGGPYPLPDDRTKSPNSAWKLDQMNRHGFAFVADPVKEPTDAENVEALIEKKRDLAVESLKADGILDSDAKITLAGKLEIKDVG